MHVSESNNDDFLFFSQNLRRGIKLSRKGEGDIWLTVLNGPVFVQSSYLDDRTNRQIRDWPHEFNAGVIVKVCREHCFYANFL